MEFDSLYLVVLLHVSSSEPNADSTFFYAQKLVEGSRVMGFKRSEHYGEMNKGNARNIKGSLIHLLVNLLNWAVQQQGNFPYSLEKLKVYDIVQGLMGVFHTMAQGKQITMNSDFLRN